MDRRSAVTGLIAFVSSLLLIVPGAYAHRTATGHGARGDAEAPAGQCTIKSLPSFVAQGEYGTTASVADVIEIGCNPEEYGEGSVVSVTDSQLASRCGEDVTWYVPGPVTPFRTALGRGVRLTLDSEGNATVALIAGPNCQPGETLVTLHEIEEPFESFTTSFAVLPPNETPEGVTALPPSQIEDDEASTAVTIVEAEFPGESEDRIRFGSEELNARCREVLVEEFEEEVFKHTPVGPGHLVWIQEDGEVTEGSEVNGLELDDDGNTFALAIGDAFCATGTSLIEADLESKPFTTATTEFTIEAPTPRDPAVVPARHRRG